MTADPVTAGEVTAGEVTAGEVTAGEVTAGEVTAGEVTAAALDASLDRGMVEALGLARQAGAAGDIPVGSVVLDPSGTIVAAAGNARESGHDPTAHAEVVALRAAGAALGSWRLSGCSLIVTLEPCTMCAGAAVLARVRRVVFGAWDPKGGAVGSLWDVVRDRRLNHRPEVIAGVRATECNRLLEDFFAARRPNPL